MNTKNDQHPTPLLQATACGMDMGCECTGMMGNGDRGRGRQLTMMCMYYVPLLSRTLARWQIILLPPLAGGTFLYLVLLHKVPSVVGEVFF
jgi:hypothetical protein